MTNQELKKALLATIPKKKPLTLGEQQKEETSSRWIIAAGLAGLVGILALINYSGKDA